MPYKFEIVHPDDEIVPTKLRLKVNNKVSVIYDKLDNELGYSFQLYNISTEEEGLNIVNAIANQMAIQSYDHGQEWRVESVEKISCQIDYAIQSGSWVVRFRVKDSY